MGFLSGVLGAVKDDEAVKNYDKDMTNKLEKVLDTLNTNIGSGRTGLAVSVEKVKGWLEGYEGEIGKKINNLTLNYRGLLHQITQAEVKINAMKTKDVNRQYNDWQEATQGMMGSVRSAQKDAKELDKELQNKLTSPMNLVEQAVKTFKKASESRDLQELNKTAAEELKNLEKLVREEIANRVKMMGNKINDEFNKQIKNPIHTVKQNLTSVDEDLKKWIEAGSKVVQQVKEKATQIHSRLVEHVKKITENARKVETEADKKVTDLLSNSTSSLNDARKNSRDLDTDCRYANRQLELLKEKTEDVLKTVKENAWKVEVLCAKLKGVLEKDMLKVFSELMVIDVMSIQTEMEGFVRSVRNIFQMLVENVKGDTEKGFEGFMVKLYSDVNSLVSLVEMLKAELKDVLERVPVKQTGVIASMSTFPKADAEELAERLKKSLEAPKSDPPIPKDKQEKSPAGQVEGSMQELEKRIKSLERNVDEKYRPLKSAIQLLKPTVDDVVRKSEAIANKKSGLSNDVTKLEDNITQLKLQFKRLVNAVTIPDLTKKINDLGDSLGNAKNKIVKHIEHTARCFESLTGELVKLQADLKSEKDNDIIQTLDDLLTQGIKGSGEWKSEESVKALQNIKKRIENDIIGISHDTPNTMTKILKDADAFYSTVIQAEAQNAIGEINKFVTSQVTEKTEAIENKARSLYSARKKEELTALKKIVQRERTNIDDIIQMDCSSGLKGLMWHLKNNHTTLSQIHIQTKLQPSAEYVQWYLDPLFDFIKEQVKTPVKPSVAPTENENSTKVHDLRQSADNLLTKLHESNHFDRTFSDNLDALKQQLTTFPPSSFSDIFNGVLLDGLRAGLNQFCDQLCYAYVNTYAGRTVRELIKSRKPEAGSKNVDAIYDLTDDGRKAAKVCLTALKTVCHDLIKVRDDFMSRALHKYKLNKTTELGKFISDCGFVLSDQHQQNGELRNSDNMKGTQIIELLKTDGKLFHNARSHIFAGRVTEVNDYLCDYYAVCNLTNGSSRQPCNVYEMLCWLTSLQYNAVYTDMLRDGIANLLETPERALGGDDEGLVSFDMKATYLNAYPKRVTYGNYEAILEHICAQSYILLTKIRGTGDASTYYAVDCCTNALKLKYPATGEECLDMLLDILRRLFPPLKYLLTQCSNDASNFGWRDCPYGKDVPTVKWPCNEHSNEKPKDQPKERPKCQPNCQAKCQVNCQSNSPLMSYLYDCLPGHLPHQLSSIGCKYTCSTCATGKTGMPCLTPLGFRGFSGDPKTGKDLCVVLTKFFEHEHLSSLLSLAPKAPSTLPEHLSFTLSLVKHWNHGGRHLIQDAFTKAITDQSIGLYEQPATLTSALCNVYGNTKKHHNMNDDGSEASLPFTSLTTSCTTQDHCAPYLQSLCDDTYAYLVSKHAGTYLSWAIYSPWTLWNYVQCLLNDFQNISCKDWGCRGCVRGDQCKRGQHGLSDDKNRKAHCQCRSIVGCRGTSPTLYRYGFTYASSEKLIINGTTCSSFFDHLTRVLKSQYMKDLLTECDKFLWLIRQPFIWLNVALWLLSFLYLLHITVIRLDLLHIKSHLHSPSSHRIAAQSLLAAARVNKLNRVFYLQP